MTSYSNNRPTYSSNYPYCTSSYGYGSSYQSTFEIKFREVSIGIFSLKFNSDATVERAISNISAEKGFPKDKIKLIYHGEVLEKDKKLREIRMDTEREFIVCYVPYEKKKVKRSVPNSAPVVIKPEQEKVESKQKIDDNFEKSIQSLLEMGFEKEKAIKALEKAKGDSQKAINYLL